MKTALPIFFIVLFTNSFFSQIKNDSTKTDAEKKYNSLKTTSVITPEILAKIDSTQAQEGKIDSTISKLNNYRWRFEFSIGDSRGVRPYKKGYFSANSQKTFGLLDLNSIDLGATYAYSKLVDFKFTLGFDRFTSKDPKSLVFETAQYRGTLQAVMNMNSLFKYQNDLSRFKLLFHAGICVSTLRNVKVANDPRPSSNDLNGGVVFGFTPMYRITKKVFLFLDFSSYNFYRQHRTWDGNFSDENNNLFGQMVNGSFGIAFSSGKRIVLETPEDKKLREENLELEKRVGELETMLNDTDKDGVADYLDNENNSIAGVEVNTRGVMIDKDKNGVPDELERYVDKTYNGEGEGQVKEKDNGDGSTEITTDKSTTKKTSKNNDAIKKSINDGYIVVFFGFNSSKPKDTSIDAINFIVTYLKANPTATVEVIGHCDEIGEAEYNNKLAIARAKNVIDIISKSGIEASRMTPVSQGEDTSVDPKSNTARGIVRKVTFKIN